MCRTTAFKSPVCSYTRICRSALVPSLMIVFTYSTALRLPKSSTTSSTSSSNSGISARFVRVPYYLTLRLMRDTTYFPQDFPNYKFHLWEGRVDTYAAKMYELYANSVYARLIYEAKTGHDSLAHRYADYVFTFDPHYTLDDIPDAPLNGEDETKGIIGFFDQLREKLAPLRRQ